jgi:hypothetical protein
MTLGFSPLQENHGFRQRSAIFFFNSFLIRPDFTLWSSSRHRFEVESCIRNKSSSKLVINYFEGNCGDISLSEGANKMKNLPNAGGSSVWSEVLSLEILHMMFNAELIRTEMELEYQWENCKMTDYSAFLFGTRLGISVTRALKFRGNFDEEDAFELLTKKLEGSNL